MEDQVEQFEGAFEVVEDLVGVDDAGDAVEAQPVAVFGLVERGPILW